MQTVVVYLQTTVPMSTYSKWLFVSHDSILMLDGMLTLSLGVSQKETHIPMCPHTLKHSCV